MVSLYKSTEKNGHHDLQIDNTVQQQLKRLRQQWSAISKVIHQSPDIDTLFQTTVTEVREKIGSDRALIYCFSSPSSGTVVAESRTVGWTPAVGETIATTIFGFEKREDYLEQQVVSFDDISTAKFTPYQSQLLDKFQIKATLSIPILLRTDKFLTSSSKSNTDVWGLLVVINCSEARQWLEEEIILLSQVACELSQALQGSQFRAVLEEQEQEQQSIAKLIDKIRLSTEVDYLFKITTQEIRQLLQCDRVAIYRFNPDWSGEFVAESVAGGWVQLVEPDVKTIWEDTHLQQTQGGRYRNHETSVVHDIYQANYTPCHIELLEQFEAKAYVIAPIFVKQKLWGLLAAYQNSRSRQWQNSEVRLLTKISNQFGIAVYQAEYLQQLQIKSEQLSQIAEQEKALTKVVNRIRESLDINAIFKITTQEIRHLLQCDRVAVFRFNSDWSGEFVAESVASGWLRLVAPDIKTVWEDTYLQETQGGRYAKGETFTVDDIYQVNHTRCHLDRLEEFEVKAYIIVPVFAGQKLWGLLAAYQNKSSRHWHSWEVNLLAQIGTQFGLALQQAEYLQQLEAKSAQLVTVSQREKAAKELLEQEAIQLLASVRPALDGDLTVRAPVTEDILGTIADAYNNTLQSLRKIVTQLQTASQQVAQTSSSSDASLEDLAKLAQRQSQQVTSALNEIRRMEESTENVVANAELVQAAVRQANKTIESGDAAMDRTVEAIQTIRETVAQTSKKIKRLSESSQKISKVINLISNFATQTNVLALNAAIEATRAGEYGKGFAVVADEVRSLSRQSAAATVEIEKLVQEIQTETGEVAVAMETGIQQVVEGTNMVNETRQNLNAIVTSTAEISNLIQQISNSTQVQMSQSVLVTNSMQDVAKISDETSTEFDKIAAVFQELSEMAQNLLTSASQFKVN
ncbi:GAF domain-containing protein [Aetokthonos hydrillicola Thurmond2011]|jgi:methyl-accepting chemotaxis protein PixJ|uniref:GAF domain-containing protein n=1 Tax=Aetokthonos hydrillicola Thurmond2011 TaxID=2712845 RepID=A0AAP5IEA8_9CYAN|nr:GAF domain-containing protein [Aetokthonos hydrillicola]MBO3461449.1 GAF domain-containing protein [Aetokthonos hydrillicola CCALA 1050]MBW4588791.1 GAF domain-containing protein [Aetokthonos hydrillicola CCALA 1050]MDR9897345.1 GAF domain-containing protein [Aetokthonos hydrillicola Thurmond2011]